MATPALSSDVCALQRAKTWLPWAAPLLCRSCERVTKPIRLPALLCVALYPCISYNARMATSTCRRKHADNSSIGLDTYKVKAARLAAGLTQEEAAKRAGLGERQKWYDIESGRRHNLTLETLDRIAA